MIATPPRPTAPRRARPRLAGWRRSVAATSAGLLLVGGLALSPLSPQAEAAAWTQDKPGVDTVGTTVPAHPDTLGKVTISSQNLNPGTVSHVDTTALYGIDGLGSSIAVGNVAIISTDDASRTQQFAVGAYPNMLEQTMVAVDSGAGYGQEGFYMWYRGPLPTGTGVPTDHFVLYYYAPRASKPTDVYFVPDMRYFGFSSAAWNSGGGAVDQLTGRVYFKMGQEEFLGPHGAMRLSIFDPSTLETFWSGPLKPATPSDDLWLGDISEGMSVPGYVAPGLAVTATGDFLLLVRGTDVAIAADDPINITGHAIAAGSTGVDFLVRVTPSFDNRDWTYSVMKMVTKDPAENSGKSIDGVQWGLAFSGGHLYVETGASLFVIDPSTGWWKYVGEVNSGGSVPPQGSAFRFGSLSSAQTAVLLKGHVDLAGSGEVLSDITIGLYEQRGAAAPQRIGSTVTAGDGHYAFAVPDVADDGSVSYLVRPVQPEVGGERAVVSAGAVMSSAPLHLENGAQLVCADASTITGDGFGNMISGSCKGIADDPALEPLGVAVDPAGFGAYGVATMRDGWSEPEIDFSLTTGPELGAWPRQGGVAGGTVLTITGADFDQFETPPAVTVDTFLSCANVTVVDDSTLTCVMPAHLAGPVTIAMVVDSHTVLEVDYLYYTSPILTIVKRGWTGVPGGATHDQIVSGQTSAVEIPSGAILAAGTLVTWTYTVSDSEDGANWGIGADPAWGQGAFGIAVVDDKLGPVCVIAALAPNSTAGCLAVGLT